MLDGVDKITWVVMERLFGLIHARSRDCVCERVGDAHSAWYIIWYMRALCHACAGLLL